MTPLWASRTRRTRDATAFTPTPFARADGGRSQPRSGRPARISLETRAAVIQIACSRPTPELAKERVRARGRDARSAAKAAKKALKRASERKRAAERRERAALCVEMRRAAHQQTRAEVRALKRATKDLAAAQALIAAAEVDAARVAKDGRQSFSAVWSHKTIQAELERQTGEHMSVSEIGRILRCGGLRPHRVRLWLHSPDPNFHAKVQVICELYLNVPPGAVVLCVDEKTGMQARYDLYPIHASEQREMRREFEYVRNGTSTLIAAFNVRTGEVFGRCWRRTAAGLERFLEALAKEHPEGEVYIVWDNLNVHKGPLIDAFNARHGGRFRFVHTPLHASWMNQVEVWFSILQRRVLKHGSFSSTGDLEAAVMGFIRQWNDVERRPFRWRFRGEFAPRLPWAA